MNDGIMRYKPNEEEFAMSKRNLQGSWKALWIGGMVGATAALLFAPKSGKRLRRDLVRGAQDLRDTTSEWARDASYSTQKAVKQVSGYASEWSDLARGMARSVLRVRKPKPRRGLLRR
jgi:gas vesicle protein